jgi:hypothetical protein
LLWKIFLSAKKKKALFPRAVPSFISSSMLTHTYTWKLCTPIDTLKSWICILCFRLASNYMTI